MEMSADNSKLFLSGEVARMLSKIRAIPNPGQSVSSLTVHVFLVKGDVGAMLSALHRDESHFELGRTKRQHVVWNVLPRRTADSDLQSAFARASYVDFKVFSTA